MNIYCDDIEKVSKENANFRKVLFTGKYCQLVVMSLKPGEEIGEEVHETVDQFFRFEEGEGKVVIEGKEYLIKDDFAVIVPAGSSHNIMNTSETENLKLYTIYSPANHPEGTIHATKAEADEYEKAHHHD
ncbi:MAG: cupin domain-containing protein [Spirochaetes bacterium]|jgi:mannose-6-phosphate isomerase-like protein (cupin superfamily)|nr:cupin domain-containing protein [Spirochaetota bacterium]